MRIVVRKYMPSKRAVVLALAEYLCLTAVFATVANFIGPQVWWAVGTFVIGGLWPTLWKSTRGKS